MARTPNWRRPSAIWKPGLPRLDRHAAPPALGHRRVEGSVTMAFEAFRQRSGHHRRVRCRAVPSPPARVPRHPRACEHADRGLGRDDHRPGALAGPQQRLCGERGRAFASNVVGDGIKPSSKIADAAKKEELQALWLAWTDDADAEGLTDFFGLQRRAAREVFLAGEVFLRIRRAGPRTV
jgi:capsid protein